MFQLPTQPADLFFSYSHEDESFRVELEKHLSMLQRDGLIRPWHDRKITAGEEWAGEIDEHLERADIVLLLVSASFLSSVYCYDVEMRRALERHENGEATVVPVILRPCDWQSAPFAKLQGLPKNARPISNWEDSDAAMLDVVRGLRRLLAGFMEPLSPTEKLSSQLDRLYEERAERLAAGHDVTDLNTTIVGIKRQMRAGPQLQAGDYLLDGRYKLHNVVGSGGFATVWKAYDRECRGLVAVKVLHSQYSENKNRRDRFFRGARQMASLQHSHIVRVFETECEDDGYYFFVMEFVPGGDFRKAVLEDRLTLAERLEILLKVGEALAFAHQQSVVHRDVKPANILVGKDNHPKLTDFDLVRAADTTGGTRTSALGTIMYAAPEAMFDGKSAAEPADVYSLGMTALFALYGKDLPQQALWERPAFIESLQDTFDQCSVFSHAVERDVSQRMPSMAEFCAALNEALAAEERLPGHQLSTSKEIDPRLGIFTLEGASETPILERIRLAEQLGREGDPRLMPERFEANMLGIPGQSWTLGKYPVTVVEFQRFVAAEGYEDFRWWDGTWFAKKKKGWLTPGHWDDQLATPNKPVIYVSFWEAAAYCRWISNLHSQLFRLPKEDEWVIAASNPKGKYPWGHEGPDEERCNFAPDLGRYNVGHPTPVGIYPRGDGVYGHCDLGGNVWEWCLPNQDTDETYPVRGGAWADAANSVRAAGQLFFRPDLRDGVVGFRVLHSLET